jgi:hypothetical protein
VAELRCVQCKYQLKGLPWWHRCPECGIPIRTSIAARRRALREEVPRHSRLLLFVAIVYAVINLAAGLFARADALPTFVVFNPVLVGLATIAAQHVNSPRPFHWRAVGWFLLFLALAGVASALG